MNLTALEILERDIIFNNIEEDNIAQVGIDLNAIEVYNIGSGGFLPIQGKTKLPHYSKIESYRNEEDKEYWFLSPGIYRVILSQGCKIPSNYSMELYPRSSLARIGGSIVAPKWDPGFQCQNMTTFIVLYKTVKIEVGARIVQACVSSNRPIEESKLYNGQYQNKS